MRCEKCGAEGIPGKKFCAECGAPLSNRCPKCGSDRGPNAKFCADCGTVLAPPAAAAPTRVADSSASEIPEGERKTVTILFADIKGSMDLMEDLDPEDARTIVDPALKLMMEAVQRYGGYVAQSTGDGIFALFGAPVAHEDHPQRALYAAVRMQEELKRYSDRIRAEGRLPVQARLGVNTGEVVVRSITTGEGRSEYVPVGHSTGIAARMQALAPVGSIAATESIRKLCYGYFLFKSLGPTKVKGVSEPVNVHEVTGLGPLRTRLQRAAGQGLTKFVGREREIESLKRAAEQARAGHGQVVAAMAEAGVGKSRLFFEFKAKNQPGWMVLEAFSVSHGKASAYLPLLDLLHSYFDIKSDDDARKRREKVTGRVLAPDRTLEDTLPYLFALFGIVEDIDPLAQMDANVRKRRTLDAFKRILLRESINQPLIVMFEDLHWIDEQTQEFLNLLADSIASAKILLLVNYRPEYTHQWGSKTYYTQLRLDPLGKESADEMLSTLLGSDASLVPLKRLIAEKTEGNPLFMEEIVLSLFEDGALARNGEVKLTKPLSSLRIPPTVQGIVASRIDRLPADEKDLLQAVAVIGTEFDLGVAGGVSGKAEDELNRMLSDLQLAEFIYEQPATSNVKYTFKHALTHDVAYNSLLTERRKLLHERAGEAMEALFQPQLNEYCTDLAYHYSRSENAEKAVKYLHLAGQQAMQRSAHREAINDFNAALDLLNTLPESAQRVQEELGLQIALGVALTPIKGWADPEVETAYARARQLSENRADTAELFPALWGLWLICLMRGNRRAADELAEQLSTLARRVDDPILTAVAHYTLANNLWITGEFAPAFQQFEKSLALYETHGRPSVASLMGGEELGVVCRSFLSLTLWPLGYPERALHGAEEGLRLARELSSPHNLAFALWITASLHQLRREPHLTHELAEAAVALATEQGFSLFAAGASVLLGWAMVQHSQSEDGIPQILRGIEASSSGGFFPLPLLAEAYRKVGQTEAGLVALNEAVNLVDKTGTRCYEAELHRLKGELLLMQNAMNDAQAENCFQEAIELARKQSAKSWELRATTSLARLLRDTNRREDARKQLAEIYNWFTEGFDTADLKDAKALLDELAG